MDDHAPTAQTSDDDEPVIHDHIACHGCGYNLRGLRESQGRCPECGAPVWISCIDDSLQYADPKWLALLARGAKGAVLSLMGGFMCFGAVVGLFVILEKHWNVSSRVSLSVLIAITAAWAIWFLVSLWLFSTPEPGRAATEGILAPRRLIRFGLLPIPVTFVLASTAYWSPAPYWLYVLILGLGAPVGVVGVTAAVAWTRCVQDLACRSGYDEAAKSAAFYGLGYRVSWGLAAFGLLFWAGATPLGCFLIMGVAGMLLFGALALILPHRIIAGMELQLSRGRQNWQFIRWIAPDPHRKAR